MAITIPRSIVYTVKKGDRGLPVFAVQRVLNSAQITTSEDFIFGDQTEENVKRLQEFLNLGSDGVVGPATQRAYVERRTKREENRVDFPRNLLLSKVLYESSAYWNAVNWSVPGGVDCGVTQRRVLESQYSNDNIVKAAFDVRGQIALSADTVRARRDVFINRAGIAGSNELAFRTAVLNHNYPALADQVSRYGIAGLSSYYYNPQDWVSRFGLKFPDGALIQTPLEWGQRYALGNTLHNEPGQAVKLVSAWK